MAHRKGKHARMAGGKKTTVVSPFAPPMGKGRKMPKRGGKSR